MSTFYTFTLLVIRFFFYRFYTFYIADTFNITTLFRGHNDIFEIPFSSIYQFLPFVLIHNANIAIRFDL